MEYTVSIIGRANKLDTTQLPEYITDNIVQSEEPILKDVLGKNMVWLLEKLMNSEGLGRRYLTQLAYEEGLSLTEGQIRHMIHSAELLGMVESKVGRKDTILTEKGYRLLSSIGFHGLRVV
ncbi:MAG: hypothetical protein AB2421_09820 [Thermotaleaceae bacterium]